MIDPSRTRRVDSRLKLALRERSLPKDFLIEGPAGTGKTRGILHWLHNLSCQLPIRVLICRQTRASLTESVLATYEDEVLPAYGHEFMAAGQQRKHRSDYQFPGGSRWVLGGLDKPERILSTAWDVVFVNEAIETEEGSWEQLWGRLNRPGRDPRLGVLLGDTNPGDPSHYLNKRCDDGRTVRWQTTHAANPALFDHGGWTPRWPTYRDSLRKLTGSRLKRFFHGLWVAGEGQWFGQFDPTPGVGHVTTSAEFDRRWPVHLAVDTGVHVGAVLWQIVEESGGAAIRVFADYYSYDVAAADNANAILAMLRDRCGGRFDAGRMDPAGGARSGFGATTIKSEFDRVGLRLEYWAKYPGCVLAGLNLVGSFLDAGKLRVHPRCSNLIAAMSNYKRAKRGGAYIDEPEGPDQHPHEDLIDPLRSSLLDRFPEGRRPEAKLMRAPAWKVF